MFHMRNVRDDLEIAFISVDGRIFELQKMSRELASARSDFQRVSIGLSCTITAAAGRV
jgi:uncharacterized membrane protein (UPF0127 family)